MAEQEPMEASKVGNLVNRGLAWIAVASSFVWLFDILALFLVLAFWVTPEEYGRVTLAASLFPVLDRIAELGAAAAVIQRDDHTEEKLSTVFWLNILVSLALLAFVSFGISPFLSWLHNDDLVGLILMVYCGKLIWQNVFTIPLALMRRELRFGEVSAIQTIANAADFGVKIGTAAAGFGVWCFVFGPLAREFVYGVAVQWRNPWRPRLVFKLRECMDWVKFGLQHSAHKFLFFLYTNIDYQVVGYFFGKEANGFYRLAYELVLEPCRAIGGSISPIAFAAYSRLKHANDALIAQFFSFTKISLVLTLGFLGIVFVNAESMIEVIWGSEWVPASHATRILCAVGVFRAVSTVVLPILDGTGHPRIAVLYTAAATIVLPIFFVASALLFGESLNYLSVAYAWAVGYPVAFFLLLHLTLKIIELSPWDYFQGLKGILLCATGATLAGWGAQLATQSFANSLNLGASAAAFLLVYFVMLDKLEGINRKSIKAAFSGK